MATVPGVSVGALLRSRPEAFGLTLDLLAGGDGLDRRHHQPPRPENRPRPRRLPRISQARARADLRRKRDPVPRKPRSAGARRTRSAGAQRRFSLRAHDRRVHAAAGARRSRRSAPALPVLQTAVADADRHRQAHVDSRRQPRRAEHHARRAHGRPRPRHAHHRRERHRQERVRARPDRPRPPAGGRRHGRSPAARRDDPDRRLPRADAPSHGAARPRRDQREGAVRHRVDALVEARRARRAARAVGSGARVRAARPGR